MITPTAAQGRAINEPTVGRLIWDGEGTEGGRYHSRRLHVPGPWSGATIGRGYDMKTKSAAKIIKDLQVAGLTLEDAKRLSALHGKSGAAAKAAIGEEEFEGFELPDLVQKKLFEISYAEEVAEVKRISNSKSAVAKYGKVEWDNLDPKILEIFVDLKYRGDYTPATRRKIQQYMISNDATGLQKAMLDKDTWKNVPADRQRRRLEFIDKAAAEQQERQRLEQVRKMNAPRRQQVLKMGPLG